MSNVPLDLQDGLAATRLASNRASSLRKVLHFGVPSAEDTVLISNATEESGVSYRRVNTTSTALTRDVGTVSVVSGSGSTADHINIFVKIYQSQGGNQRGGVYSFIAQACGAGLTAKTISAVAAVQTFGTAITAPTAAWLGNTLQVSLNETTSGYLIEATISGRPSGQSNLWTIA